MTHTTALALREGQYVTTRHELHKKAHRVTKVWVNEDQTIVRIRIHRAYGDVWISPDEYEITANPNQKAKHA